MYNNFFCLALHYIYGVVQVLKRFLSDIKVLCPLTVYVVSGSIVAIASALILHTYAATQFVDKRHTS